MEPKMRGSNGANTGLTRRRFDCLVILYTRGKEKGELVRFKITTIFSPSWFWIGFGYYPEIKTLDIAFPFGLLTINKVD